MIDEVIKAAWMLISGHQDGRKNRPDKHLCDSCAENIQELKEALLAANLQPPANLYE